MLEGIAAQIREAAVKRLHHEAEEVANLARSKAKGSLAAHISVSVEQDGESHWTATVFSADPHGRSTDPKAKDPSKYNVPFFREHGTRYQAAQPYMRPALEERREAFTEGMQEAVTQAAKSAHGRKVRGKVRIRLQAGG